MSTVMDRICSLKRPSRLISVSSCRRSASKFLEAVAEQMWRRARQGVDRRDDLVGRALDGSAGQATRPTA